RSLLNFMHWHQQNVGINKGDRVSQMCVTNFDASVFEIWPHLGAGATLEIIADVTMFSAAELAQWLVRRQVTVSFIPTALAEQVLSEPGLAGSALRCLLTGGDQLHERAPQWAGFELWNHYGPTEATVVVTAGRVEEVGTGVLPDIGRPIGNTEVEI